MKVYDKEKIDNKIKDNEDDYNYSINSLIYNDTNLNCTAVEENVYNLHLAGNFKDDKDQIDGLMKILKCDNPSKALVASNTIMKKEQEDAKKKIKK